MSDRPYSVSVGAAKTDRWLLTHVEWHPCHMGIDIAQPETGVREFTGGRFGNFQLIQHGWTNFDAAEAVILRALSKNWSAYRIERLMSWMRERQRDRAVIL